MRHSKLSWLLGSLVLGSLASTGSAALMLPGTTLAAVAEVDPTGGSVVATQVQPFATAGYTGTLTSTVIAGDATNPLGGLTFTYAITSSASSTVPITRLAVNGFAPFTVDVSYKPGTGTVAPTAQDRDASGGVIGFTYLGTPIGAGKIEPGATTHLMVVQTNAADYSASPANVIDGSISAVTSYAPIVVPEPASIASILVAGTLLRRRR